MKTIKKLFYLLIKKERIKLYLLFLAMIIVAVLQVVSIASIMPFLSVASDPSVINDNYYLNWAYKKFNFESTDAFLVALGAAALTTLLVSNAFIVFATWARENYVWGRSSSLAHRLLQSYVYRSYEYFLTRNSAELTKNVVQEVREVTTGLMQPIMKGLAKGIVALFIVGFITTIDPVVALTAALVLGGSYTLVYSIVRGRLDRAGKQRVEANTRRHQIASEVFGGIKQVILQQKEQAFVDQYDEPQNRYAQAQISSNIAKKVPRYILEGVAFGGIILIAVYLIIVRNNVSQVIPTLGLYAFAGYRLMPALQQAFKGITSAKYNIAALEDLYRDTQDVATLKSYDQRDSDKRISKNDIRVREEIMMESVSFTYPEAEEPAIKNLSVGIPANTTLGFVGKTGSGKTTTVDLVLGLLRPQEGKLKIDGTPLESTNIRQWQENLGYVPQDIYLSDDSIARNIAFGVPEKNIDMQSVRDAARRAHIHDFVENELPDKWETNVGERGVKLSGGQRQRIGIARALYHNPSVLVFDEATSALDQSTEKSVMEAIYGLEGDHTILMIAHRLSTVRRADKIVMLENGSKVGEGTYESLEKEHKKFRSMALS